ncbi:MAG: ClpP-like prohead protease/major capsid protein fusion protein [Pseudomonadota bacterium]
MTVDRQTLRHRLEQGDKRRAKAELYEAARDDRRRRTPRIRLGPNRSQRRSRAFIRERARELEANYDVASTILDMVVSHVVGPDGVQVYPMVRLQDGSDATALNQFLYELLMQHGEQVEITGRLDRGMMHSLAARSWLRDGEIFGRLLQGRRPGLHRSRDMALPLSVQLLEAEYCPENLFTQDAPDGIITNDWGRPVAFRIYRQHPNDWLGTQTLLRETIEVPASQMLHVAHMQRVGQLRGMSVFANCMNRLQDLREGEQYELIAFKMAAAIVLSIDRDLGLEAGDQGDARPAEFLFEEGMLFDKLAPGEKLNLHENPRPNNNFQQWRRENIRAASGGAKAPYSPAANDYEGSYSSRRMEQAVHHRVFERLTSDFSCGFVKPLHRAQIRAALVYSLIPPELLRGVDMSTMEDALFVGPGQVYVDYQREIAGEMASIEGGLESLTEVQMRRGRNPHRTQRLRQIEQQRGTDRGESETDASQARRAALVRLNRMNKEDDMDIDAVAMAKPKWLAEYDKLEREHLSKHFEQHATEEWFALRVEEGDKRVCHIDVFGVIGWNITADEFGERLDELGEVDEIALRINSPGGYVSDGIAMFNLIRQHKATVSVNIVGMAASMASVIAMVADEGQLGIAEGAQIMIHNAWSWAVGDHRDLRRTANVIEKMTNAIARIYQRRSGRDLAAIRDMMDDETWLFDEEAVTSGFADFTVEAETEELEAAAALRAKHFESGARRHPTKTGERNMPPNKQKGAAAASDSPSTTENTNSAPVVNEQDTPTSEPAALTMADFQKAENARREQINTLARALPDTVEAQALVTEMLNDATCTADQAKDRIIAFSTTYNSVETVNSTNRVDAGEDQSDKFRKGAAQAILAKSKVTEVYGTDDKRHIAVDRTSEFTSMGLKEMAKMSLRNAGIPVVGNPMTVIGRAFADTDDFPEILRDAANKSMLVGWDVHPETYQLWTRSMSASDFKRQHMVGAGQLPSLRRLLPNGEYRTVQMDDRGQSAQLETFGEIVPVTRQTIINDDLGAFTETPMKLARAARQLVGDLVYAVLMGNPNMDEDGLPIFDAAHNNVQTAAIPSIDSVSAMRNAMALQTSVGGYARTGARLAFLIGPYALHDRMWELVNSTADPKRAGAGGVDISNSGTANVHRGQFDVITDHRFDSMPTEWYGATSQGTDTVAVITLDGNDEPFLDEEVAFHVDGVTFKVRHDVDAVQLDHRGLQYNPGQ